MKSTRYKVDIVVLIIFILVPIIFIGPISAILAEVQSSKLVELKTRPGVTQKLILIKPTKPVASVILFEGGSGYLGLGQFFGKPTIGVKGGTLLVRNREDFAKHGLMVAVITLPCNQKGLASKRGIDAIIRSDTFRMSEEHARDIKAVVSHLKNEANLPVWLVGISRGTFSATNGAARIKEGIDGLVLLSSMTRTGRAHPKSILDMNLEKITVPTMILSHKNDECFVTPASDAPLIKEALVNSPRAEVVYMIGGKKTEPNPRSPSPPDCQPQTPHGFYGIEKQVVTAIVDFIKSNSK